MRFLTIFLFVFVGTIFPKNDSTVVNLADTMHTDTLLTDTLHSARLFVDTSSHDQKGMTVDSLAATKVAAKVESPNKSGPLLIKRTYDFKSQVRVGIAMMLFIAVIFGTAQSWNP
jgi:hypothetical protein